LTEREGALNVARLAPDQASSKLEVVVPVMVGYKAVILVAAVDVLQRNIRAISKIRETIDADWRESGSLAV